MAEEGELERYVIQACLYDNNDFLSDLIKGGECDINEQDCWGRTTVFTAVSNNSIHCLQTLLANGADVNRAPSEPSCGKMTPLHIAVFDGKFQFVKLLLEHGADISTHDALGRTTLDIANQAGHREIVAYLKSALDRKQMAMSKLFRELNNALARGDVDATLKLLDENKSDDVEYVVIHPSGDSLPLLCSACKRGNLEVVKKLIKFHVPATSLAHKETGLTPLHIACEHGNVELIQLLLQHFPEQILMRTIDHQLPLHKAAACGMADALKCLLDFSSQDFSRAYQDHVTGECYWSSIDVNEVDINGRTPLHLASEKGFLDVVQFLLNFSINTQSTGKKSPSKNRESVLKDESSLDNRLSHCSMQSDSSSVKTDSVHPVNVNLVMNSGKTALHLAIESCHHDIADVLLRAGADVKMPVHLKDVSVSLLSFTLSKGDSILFSLMMNYGAEDVDNSALAEASLLGKDDIRQLLLQHKSSRDLTRLINKSEMKRRVSFNVSDRSMSLDPELRAQFPLHAVSMNWHNIGDLTDIHRATILQACYLHNPAMQRVNSFLPLFAITKIDISKNCFEELPLIIFELFSLCVLIASENKIKTLPSEEDIEESLQSMVLEELHLNDNCLQVIPSYLFKMPALKLLNVAKNELHDIPIDIWLAPSLVTLNLARNSLSSLPHVSATDCGYIGTAVNYSSETSSEPENVNMSDVDSVHSFLIENKVPHINRWQARVEIDNRNLLKMEAQKYDGIRQLDLSRNRFTEIPLCLACCAPHLEILSLQHNRLKSVGMLSNLPKSLVELNLSHCGLETLAPWSRHLGYEQPCLGYQSHLFVSQLSPSPVHGYSLLPPSPCQHRPHTKLKKLDKLNVSHNNLRILTLMKLKHRHGSSGTSDSDEMFHTRAPTEESEVTTCSLGLEIEEIRSLLLFPELNELDASYNSLISLPREIGEHSNLKVLCLNMNRALKELPPTLGLLKQLWKLEIEYCPLEGAIQDFIRNSSYSTKDILGFLLSVFEESTEYNCMNLMLVGSHNIGKTSLLHRLRKEGIAPQKASHWRDRVSGTAPVQNQILSTVGIDINELIIQCSSDCTVNFRTWDFGGQREYYATHQYFLSPRSLYLVMWNLADSLQGINGLLQWLVNIQARAPGAPVIIVGTHLDVLKVGYPNDYEEAMTSHIEKMFLMNREPDKCGLPNILGTINVSCKTGTNISSLVKLISRHVLELKHPRSRTQKLLKQKIPKKYILLKNVVEKLAQERMEQGKDPVLSKSNYMLCVSNKMMEFSGTFRDPDELDQATRFLHENGVMFHYDDLQLRDLFFLDPQWLCDQLAKVVTIKEINNFASKGVMKIRDLEILFRSRTVQPSDIQNNITNLLNKFEVALQFDEEHLLLPSLLPTEQEHHEIKIALRRRDGLRRQIIENTVTRDAILQLIGVRPTINPIFSYCRLYFMTYFPSGFWPRLITRVLADTSLYEIVLNLFHIPADLLACSPRVKTMTENTPEWQCWQTGLSLYYLGFEMLRIHEVQLDSNMSVCDYTLRRIKCNIDSDWSFLDVVNSKLLEVTFKTDSLAFQLTHKEGPQVQTLGSARTDMVYRDDRVTAGLMVKLVAHIDNLLQDWYPELGEQRFCQNCEGRYLITRVIPCPHCLSEEVTRQGNKRQSGNWMMVTPEMEPSVVELDIDSNINNDVFEPRPMHLVGGQILQNRAANQECVMYSFLVERCILDVLNGVNTCCPVHESVSPVQMFGVDGCSRTFYISPDVVFSDLSDDILVSHTDRLDMGEYLGHGTFGKVYSGNLFRKGEEPAVPVAIKILFDKTRHSSRKGMEQRMDVACQSYLTARREISILEKIQHKNIVPMLGLRVVPLSLILSLASQGALDKILKNMTENCQTLPVFVVRQVILQIADALMYLHDHDIIYRDLKSENVMVWSIPTSADARPSFPVLVKLADYGISQSVMPSGSRGFGGTPPFIAPEILQRAGKDTYTQKVDIFSFGMFIYELITCRLPFLEVNNPSTLICQGCRPTITSQEVSLYSCYVLDLMTICWSQEPDQRPTAEKIIEIADSPQFCHLRDVIPLGTDVRIFCACSIPPSDKECDAAEMDFECLSIEDQSEADSQAQVWISTGVGPCYSLNVYTFDQWKYCIKNWTWQLDGPEIIAMSVFDGFVWCIDARGWLHIYCSKTRVVLSKVKLPVMFKLFVHGMFHHAEESLVFIVSKNGSVMLCKHDGHGRIMDDVKIEKSSQVINMCSALVETRLGYKLWFGHLGGKISVWNFESRSLESGELAHSASIDQKAVCKFLLASHVPGCEDMLVWSYVYPGKIVYRWDANSQCIVDTLDCSDIVITTKSPVVVSPKRGDGSYQVTCLNVLDNYLYIGTTWGNVIVADAVTMTPLQVFRSHCDKEFYVKYILPLQNDQTTNDVDISNLPGIVTIGKGFQDMIRNAQHPEVESSSLSEFSEMESKVRSLSASRELTLNNTFLISWSASDWQFY